MSLKSHEKQETSVVKSSSPAELLPDISEKEKKYIESLGSFITKYQVDGEDKALGADHCQAISDFIGENGAIFLVKRDGKTYYSSNFSYPKDAPLVQLERVAEVQGHALHHVGTGGYENAVLIAPLVHGERGRPVVHPDLAPRSQTPVIGQ